MTANENVNDRFLYLYEESKSFFASVGVAHDLLLKIFRADSDWEFILKIDALLETAVKEVMKKSLGFNNEGKFVGGQLDEFIEALPINGRTRLFPCSRKTAALTI
jgi:hypothetical protein